jgi:hypothetical protein
MAILAVLKRNKPEIRRQVSAAVGRYYQTWLLEAKISGRLRKRPMRLFEAIISWRTLYIGSINQQGFELRGVFFAGCWRRGVIAEHIHGFRARGDYQLIAHLQDGAGTGRDLMIAS